MEKSIKTALIDGAKTLIDAVEREDYAAIAEAFKFLAFGVETVGRYNALTSYIEEKNKVELEKE